MLLVDEVLLQRPRVWADRLWSGKGTRRMAVYVPKRFVFGVL